MKYLAIYDPYGDGSVTHKHVCKSKAEAKKYMKKFTIYGQKTDSSDWKIERVR